MIIAKQKVMVALWDRYFRKFNVERYPRILGLLSCLLCGWCIAAEPLVPSPNFYFVSTRIGLTQDQINDIVIDNDGFTWIATEGGLNRWDGYRVEAISGPSNVFTNTGITALFLDRNNGLWISTYGSGIYRYDLIANHIEQVVEKTFRHHPDWIQYADHITSDARGNVLITLYEEVVRYHPDSGELETLFALSDSQLDNEDSIRFAIVKNDILLVGGTYGLIAKDLRSAHGEITKIDHLAGSKANINNINVKHLLLDDEMRLWVGTVEGLYLADFSSVVTAVRQGKAPANFEVVEPARNVWAQLQLGEGNFWIGTDNGLARLTHQENQWQWTHVLEPHNQTTELSNKSIRTLVADKDHNLWLGSVNAGALYWSPKILRMEILQNSRFQNTDLLSNNSVWSFLQTDEDILWIGTEDGLTQLNITDGTSNLYLTKASLEASEPLLVNAIFPGSDNTLVLQTTIGMREFNVTTGSLSPLSTASERPDGVSSWEYGAAADNNNRLFFISDQYKRYDPKTKELITFSLPSELFDPTFAVTFLPASDYYQDRIFLAMLDGLWLIDPDTFEYELVYRFPEKQKNNAVSVTSYAVVNNRLWLAFPRFGLIALDARTFEVLEVLDNTNLLTSNIVYGLQVDAQANLWFSSHAGLHRYSTVTNVLKNYRYGLELSVSEFNEGASVVLNSGKMLFGSTNGAVKFDPQALAAFVNDNRFVQPMVISSIELDSRPLFTSMTNLSGQHFDLLHDDYGVTLTFSSTITSSVGDASYRYKLSRGTALVSEGVTQDPQINFAFLAPGRYRFEVSPARQTMDYTLLPARLSFTVPYPPWSSPWAYAFYVTFGLTVLFFYLFARHRQLLRLNSAQQQVRLFGDAFKHTRDWVLIFDDKLHPLAANPALENVFGLSGRESLDKQLDRLYVRFPRLKRQISTRLAQLKPGDYWKDEDTIEGLDGNQYDVLIDITAIRDEENPDAIHHYLLVISDITEQKNAERKLIKIASFDSLTGLVNRNSLLERLERATLEAHETDRKVAVLFVDLDRFKGINDSLGHDYGDKLLRVIANRMLNLASGSDTVARLGGDEFVIVIEGIEDPNSLGEFVGRLIESVETPISLGKEVLRVSCSVGVSFYPDDTTEPEELIKQADVAMYSAKKDALNGFTYYTTEMNERAKQRLQMENLVKLAWQDQCFFNHYQPIVNGKTGTVDGLELLMRCKINSQTLSPAEFIPVLEQLRYIIEATRHAMERGIEDLAAWYEQGFRGYLSVNLSALHFKTEFDFSTVIAMLEEKGLPVSALRFEITEGVLMDDTENALRLIRRFDEAGFVLALDDFGTGYSSLSYLKRFPLKVLKIDKSFVDDITPVNEDYALVLTTINLANSLNMVAVAEGIETTYQAQYLMRHGCICHQGYFYSAPVGAADIPTLLEKRWPVLTAN